MAGKQTVITLILIVLIASVPLTAQEETVTIGGEEGWGRLLVQDGIELRPGRRNHPEAVLAGAAYHPDADTDMLLHFDESRRRDATGAYEVQDGLRVTTKVSRRGTGAGVFSREDGPIRLRAVADGLFVPRRVWGDFTMEFWSYPTRTAEGETIFLWEGARNTEGEIVSQEIRVSIKDRRLQWRFENVFLPPDQEEFEVSLESRTDLVPRTWQHHMIRYNSGTGLLEYLRDGRTEAVTHATESRSEGGSVYVPYIGDASNQVVELGKSFVGFLDEFRLSSAFRDPPELGIYEPSGGSVVTRPLDLESTGARVTGFDAESAMPESSAVHFYYRTAEERLELENADPGSDWIPFEPGKELDEPIQTRFVQLRAELYPDGERREGPRLMNMQISYRPDTPPSPPTHLVAIPGDGEVTLIWRGAAESDLTGYEVFYGTRSGRYFGSGAEIGDSPVSIGNTNEVTIDGLENGTLYFFAVASRDESSKDGTSVLSSEVTARPSRLGR
ncbi:MAG: LamG-like jellyroll fold domain-containing protein [Spirochaetota bacterium]